MCKCKTQKFQIEEVIKRIKEARDSERYDLDTREISTEHKNWILGFLDATDMVLRELNEILGDA